MLNALNIKIMDFNVYDMFKNNNNTDGGDNDKFLILLQNLEKKVFVKFDSVDDRIEKLIEDVKQDKENIDKLNKDQIIIKDQIKIIFIEIEDLKKKIAKILKDLEDLSKLRDYIDEKINDLLNRITNIKISGGGGGGGLNADDLRLLMDLEKRVIALEKLGKLILEIDITVKNQ